MRMNMTSGVLALALAFSSGFAGVGADGSQAVVPARTDNEERFDLGGFSLTLVLGDMKPGTGSTPLPAPAARALAGMKDFLPYKRYTTLDTAWTIGSRAIKVQLRQSDTQVFDVELEAAQGTEILPGTPPVFRGSPTIHITSFRMQRAGLATRSTERASIEQALRTAERALDALLRQQGEQTDEKAVAALEARLSLLQARHEALKASLQQVAAKDALIDTAFRMKLGETLVVGTSRQQGDSALIVIITAVAK